MKKAKILALVLVAALMLTGGAYALWNQSVTLSTTAAMGNMNVALTCDHAIYPMSYMPGIAGGAWLTRGDAEDYMNPLTGTVSTDKQSINVTVGKMYPGAKYGLNYEIANTGDVPFNLQGVTITCTDNYNLFTHLKGAFQFTYMRADGSSRLISVPAADLTTAGLGDAIVAACKDIVVYPGDQLKGWFSNQDNVTTFMQVAVDSTIANSDFEKESTSFNVAFNWQQCNPVQVG